MGLPEMGKHDFEPTPWGPWIFVDDRFPEGNDPRIVSNGTDTVDNCDYIYIHNIIICIYIYNIVIYIYIYTLQYYNIYIYSGGFLELGILKSPCLFQYEVMVY
jgi:hypothetical protein